jgi:hypothetical protein
VRSTYIKGKRNGISTEILTNATGLPNNIKGTERDYEKEYCFETRRNKYGGNWDIREDKEEAQ